MNDMAEREPEEINKDLLKRQQKLESDRSVIQSIWDAIERVITPYRGRMFKDERDESSLEWTKSRHVYDSTAIMAHQNLSASIHGAITSPSIQWFQIRFRDEKLNKNKTAIQWLQDVSSTIMHELQDSNFNLEINECYQDLTGAGTAFITLEEGEGSKSEWNGLQFTSVPIKEGFFENDHNGRVLRWYRKLQWTPAQLLSKFGEEGVSSVIKKLDEDGNQEKLDVLFSVYPRGNRVPKFSDTIQKAAPSRRPFESRYICCKDSTTLGKPGGYYEMPTFAPRWRKTNSSVWGNSPAMMALADVLSLNEARRMQLVMSEKLIDPPILAEERAIITDLNLKAASLSVVRDIQGIEAFNTEASMPVSQEMIDQLQAAVRNYFFVDQLTFPAPQAQPMTATEAQIRYELMQRLLGPTLGRIQNDLLDPIVQRAFRMLAREGKLPEPPQAVIDAGAEYDIEYMGSLARAQKTDTVVSIERLVASTGAMAEVYPDATLAVDPIAAVREMGHALNVPAGILNDEKEVDAERQRRAALQQAAEQAAADQAQGEADQAVGAGAQAITAAEEGMANGPGQPQGTA
jgi:hypothetical protein